MTAVLQKTFENKRNDENVVIAGHREYFRDIYNTVRLQSIVPRFKHLIAPFNPALEKG